MKKLTIFLLLIALLGSSCSKLTRVLKNPDMDEKYKAALDYYEEEDYYRASLVFEDLLPNLLGKAEAEDVQFYNAYSYYHQQQYETAAYYFKQFHDTYRRSDYAQEALYMYAHSMYKSTPDYNLDQSNTNESINAMQDFINRYPQSTYVPEAEEIIQGLRDKLEEKAYTIARQYHKLRYYKAAIIAYENFTKDFPDSELKDEIYYRMVEAQYELAEASVTSLKRDRYQQALDNYYQLVDRYPESPYLQQAEDYFEKSQEELRDLQPAQAAQGQ